MQAIIALYKEGNLKISLQKALKLKKVYPRNPDVLNVLGIIYRSLKKWELSLAEYNKILEEFPDNTTYLNNKGNVLRDSGRLHDAEKAYKRAVELKPNNSIYWCNLSKVYNDSQLFIQAEHAANQARRISPLNVEALNNLGLALEGQHKFKPALSIYQEGFSIAPNNAAINNNLGNLFFKLSNFDAAIWHIKKSISIKPSSVTAHYNLCELYEKTNNIKKLTATVSKALIETNNDPQIRLKKGQLEFRKKDYKKSIITLQSIPESEIPKARRSVLFEILGKSFDYCKSYNEAFYYFKKMNSIFSESLKSSSVQEGRYLALVKKLRESFANDSKSYRVKSISKSKVTPIFLIGFPRSGTTLLDTVLRSHSMIDVIEEKPLINQLVIDAGGFVDQRLLSQFTAAQIKSFEKKYLKKIRELLPNRTSNGLVIDKLPLNIIHVQLIQKVFPKAKFILLLRHPYDCALSCFMQNFQLNDAMENFLDLGKTAQLYSEVMALWTTYSKSFDLDVKTIKYENLITDFENTTKSILSFLELNWDTNLHNFSKTGRDRNRINTPSYNQVTEKLYRRSIGRWKNYEDHFFNDFKSLQQWVKKYNY